MQVSATPNDKRFVAITASKIYTYEKNIRILELEKQVLPKKRVVPFVDPNGVGSQPGVVQNSYTSNSRRLKLRMVNSQGIPFWEWEPDGKGGFSAGSESGSNSGFDSGFDSSSSSSSSPSPSTCLFEGNRVLSVFTPPRKSPSELRALRAEIESRINVRGVGIAKRRIALEQLARQEEEFSQSFAILSVNPVFGKGVSNRNSPSEKYSPLRYSPINRISHLSAVPKDSETLHIGSGLHIWNNVESRSLQLSEMIEDSATRNRFPLDSAVKILESIDGLILARVNQKLVEADEISQQYERFQKVLNIIGSTSIEGERNQAIETAIRTGLKITGM